MKKVLFLLYSLSLSIPIFSQISIDTDTPNDNVTHLVNNVLLSSGVEASNFSYQGHPKQIGYIDCSNSNIGLDGGIVLSTGDISALDPNFTGFPEFVAQTPPIENPDLLQRANSVPALIGQNFVVSSVNDVAIIEFDFVPSNDTITFNYVFGSQEYFGYKILPSMMCSVFLSVDLASMVPIQAQQDSQTDASLSLYSIYLNNGAETIRYASNTNLFSMYSGGEYVFNVDKIVDSLGCESIDNYGEAPVLFKELKNINIITSIDSVLCQVDSLVQLLATPEGGVWYGKGLDTENNFNPANGYDGQNWLYYNFPQNCNETDSISIEVGCDVSLYIPNSFTPNGDYDNELLSYRGYNIIDFDFSVYSRWGEILIQTNDITEFWDGRFKGRVVKPGTYTYVAKIYGKDAKYKFQRGSINVLK